MAEEKGAANLVTLLLRGNGSILRDALGKILDRLSSTDFDYPYGLNETGFKAMTVTLLQPYLSEANATIVSEKETVKDDGRSKGYADLVLEHRDSRTIVVLELKWKPLAFASAIPLRFPDNSVDKRRLLDRRAIEVCQWLADTNHVVADFNDHGEKTPTRFGDVLHKAMAQAVGYGRSLHASGRKNVWVMVVYGCGKFVRVEVDSQFAKPSFSSFPSSSASFSSSSCSSSIPTRATQTQHHESDDASPMFLIGIGIILVIILLLFVK